MNLKKLYNKFKRKYIGEIQYIVTIINVSLLVEIHQFNTIKQVNEFVDEINLNAYWMIQKIDKIRLFDFQYNRKIIHSPLHFQSDNVTEMYELNDWKYSFIKKDKSLSNIIRSLRAKEKI